MQPFTTLKDILSDKGISYNKLAKEVGISANMVSCLCKKPPSLPNVITGIKIAKYLKTDITKIWGEK